MKNINYESIRHLYVSQLDFDLQSSIKKELIDFFIEELDLNEAHSKEELDLAMNSRVSDLEDTINIKKILHQL